MDVELGCSSENVSTFDDIESISLPSLPESLDSMTSALAFDHGDQHSTESKENLPINKKNAVGHEQPKTISERRLGKKIPSLNKNHNNSREILKIGLSLQTAKITEGPVIHKKPKIVQTEATANRVRIPDVCIEDVKMEEEEEMAVAEAPKTRRVSDVIDSLGSSTPSSPRTPAPPSEHNGVAKSSMAFLPNGNDKSAAPDRTKRIPDRTDSAPMGKHDDSDAKPFGVEEDEQRHVCARMPVDKHSDEYNMNHKRRGHAVIFNHDKFDASYEPRLGSDVDAEALEKAFQVLHFQVTVYHNLEHCEIKKVISNLKEEDHTDADCLVVVVLSHGIHGGYVLSKDVPYPVDFLWHSFKADVCPTLAGKPKMFFIQACRGERMDRGVVMMRSPARTQVDSAASEYKIPSFADFLIAFSTVEGHYAWRNPEQGTWFIQCLCKELSENGTTVDVLKLMTRTARRVALDFESFNDLVPWHSEMKQVPQVTSMLIRCVYFRPKDEEATKPVLPGSDSNSIESAMEM